MKEAAARQQTKRFVAVQVTVATVQRKVIRRLSDPVSYQLRYFTSLALVMHDQITALLESSELA